VNRLSVLICNYFVFYGRVMEQVLFVTGWST